MKLSLAGFKLTSILGNFALHMCRKAAKNGNRTTVQRLMRTLVLPALICTFRQTLSLTSIQLLMYHLNAPVVGDPTNRYPLAHESVES